MRPAGNEPRPNATVTAERKPWFAERHNTTDRGKTPLAWAPTAQQAPAPPAPARASRRWLAVAVAVAAVGGGIAVWKLRGDAEAPVAASQTTPVLPSTGSAGASLPPTKMVAAKEDPWGSPVATEQPPVPPLTVTGPEVSVAIAQAEVARAITHLPADTSFLATALVGQLQRDGRFDAVFAKLASQPQVSLMLGSLPPCVKTLLASSEWFAFGSAGFEADKHGTLVVRGRWSRKDVEGCFPQTQDFEMTDGRKLVQLPEIGWLDFLDDNTAYLSVRQDLAAAQVHDNVVKGVGLTKHTRELVATLSADRAFLFVADGTGGVAWPGDPLPAGSHMAATMQVSEPSIAFHVAMYVPTEPAAKTLAAKLDKELEAFRGAGASPGQFRVTRTGTKVVVEATLSTLMMGIVSSSISAL